MTGCASHVIGSIGFWWDRASGDQQVGRIRQEKSHVCLPGSPACRRWDFFPLLPPHTVPSEFKCFYRLHRAWTPQRMKREAGAVYRLADLHRVAGGLPKVFWITFALVIYYTHCARMMRNTYARDPTNTSHPMPTEWWRSGLLMHCFLCCWKPMCPKPSSSK